MSIPVDPTDLAKTLHGYGAGYLLTTSAAGRVKAVTVRASVVDGVVRLPVRSGGTERNLATNPAATLLFPPLEAGGYTLLVDGEAAASDAGFTVRPSSAVLHRPADHTDGDGAASSACGHDCEPV